MMQLLHGNCLEIMPTIPDKSIDMILCDLPYGTTACKWDVIIPFEPLWIEYKRVIKDRGCIALFGSEPFSSYLRVSNIKMFKYDWIWDKHIPRNFVNAKIMPMNKHENISVFGVGKINYYPIMVERDKPVTVKNYAKKGKDSTYKINTEGQTLKSYTYTHRNPDTIIHGLWEANAGKVHTTQKPVTLLEYLIKTYTLENETVLDNCMGSGSTGVACVNINRNFIGIEKDDKYFEIAKERIKLYDKTNNGE